MLTFDHYGLHWIEGDIALLVQQGKVDHVLGIPMHYDVTVKIPRQGLHCPHDIQLSDTSGHPLPDDPLARAMLPVPKEFGQPALFIEDTNENKRLVRELLRLSSTKTSEMRPIWMGNPTLVASQLRLTNLSPLILFGYKPEHLWATRKIIEASFYAPRQLIMLGPRDMVLQEEVLRHTARFNLQDLEGLPLEHIGAEHLKQHMLRKS